LPAQEEFSTLPTVVVSGLIQPDLDMMEDRSDSLYEQGWVLDVSKVERDTKRKVERCGGLGYIDMKVALYGIPQSGTLRLFLPFESASNHHDVHEHGGENNDDLLAQHWMDDVILCEANEKRSEDACQLDKDLAIVLGGKPVHKITPINGAGVYLNRKTCVHVSIPPMATMTKLSDLTKVDGTALTPTEQARWQPKATQQQPNNNNNNREVIGLVVDLHPKERVTRKQGACCVSHIIWEQH